MSPRRWKDIPDRAARVTRRAERAAARGKLPQSRRLGIGAIGLVAVAFMLFAGCSSGTNSTSGGTPASSANATVPSGPTMPPSGAVLATPSPSDQPSVANQTAGAQKALALQQAVYNYLVAHGYTQQKSAGDTVTDNNGYETYVAKNIEAGSSSTLQPLDAQTLQEYVSVDAYCKSTNIETYVMAYKKPTPGNSELGAGIPDVLGPGQAVVMTATQAQGVPTSFVINGTKDLGRIPAC